MLPFEMSGRRTYAPPASPPANAAEGAAALRHVVIGLFDRKNGEGVDWELIAGSLFRLGFDLIATKLPEDRRAVFARHVHTRSYEVIQAASDDESGSGQPPTVQRVTEPVSAAALKAPRPRPPR